VIIGLLAFLLLPSLCFAQSYSDFEREALAKLEAKALKFQDAEEGFQDQMKNWVKSEGVALNKKPMDNEMKEPCPNGKGIIAFEAKPFTGAGKDNFVNWGFVGSVPAGSIRYTPSVPVPKGAASQTTKHFNPAMYDNCMMDRGLVLEIVKLACELDAKIVSIHSAFRDPINNWMEGGKSNSEHLFCRAMDFSLKNSKGEVIGHRRVQARAKENAKFRGMGLAKTFTHLDTRKVIRKKAKGIESNPNRNTWTYK